MLRKSFLAPAVFLSFLFLSLTCSARLTQLVITQSVPLAGGVPWGDVGPYEKLLGTAYFARR
jgi:hypothetical protein